MKARSINRDSQPANRYIDKDSMSATISSPLEPLRIRKDAHLMWVLSLPEDPPHIGIFRDNADNTFRVISLVSSATNLFDLLENSGIADTDFNSRGAALAAIYAVTALDQSKVKLLRQGNRRSGYWITANNAFMLVREKISPAEKAWLIVPGPAKHGLGAASFLKATYLTGKYFTTRRQALDALEKSLGKEQLAEALASV